MSITKNVTGNAVVKPINRKFDVYQRRGEFVSVTSDGWHCESCYDTLSDVLFDVVGAFEDAEEDLGNYYPEELLARVRDTLQELTRELMQHEIDTKVITQQRTKAAEESRTKA